jgi:hypothetical protein
MQLRQDVLFHCQEASDFINTFSLSWGNSLAFVGLAVFSVSLDHIPAMALLHLQIDSDRPLQISPEGWDMSQIPAMLEGCSLRAAQENFKVHLYT